jgi:hypothetical protein
MFKIGLHRAMGIVLALAALAFTASGVPDKNGTDAAIGWFAFLVLSLAFLALTGAAVVRRRRTKEAHMKRLSLLAAALLAALAASVVLAAGGGAQTPDGHTFTFLDDTNHATQAFLDTAPKSPVRNPQSRRFRLSTGDTLYVHSPILDHAGGTRIGTAYSQFTVVSGNSFANAVFRGHGAFKLRDSQIAADGIVRPANTTNTVPVLGGTGAYEGTRGSLTFTQVRDGSQDTFHLLP